MSGKGTACMAKIAKCLSDPINYVMDEWGEFYCPKCDDGYTWNYVWATGAKVPTGSCTLCDTAIDGCL